MATTSSVRIVVFDGTRQPMQDGTKILYTCINGTHEARYRDIQKVSSLVIDGLPFYDNLSDRYAVLASADGYQQSGFCPVSLSPNQIPTVELMLIPTKPMFDFSAATWESAKVAWPWLGVGVTDAAAKARWDSLRKAKPRVLAALLNILTAMDQIFLPQGRPADYFRQIKWDSLAQDRFFAYCDPGFKDQMLLAAAHGDFAPEFLPGLVHDGATASWKQVQFGEANVQLTFHEGDTRMIGGINCVAVEPDIDYYQDPSSHFLLEFLANKFTGGLTSPEVVYVLRWIAGRRAGVPEFSPPYTILPI